MRLFENHELLVWRDVDHPSPLVHFEGEVTSESADRELAPVVEALHAEMLAQSQPALEVDLSGLQFLNSRGIKCLVNWVLSLQALSAENCYALKFLYDPRVTWQRSTLTVLVQLNRGQAPVSVHPVGAGEAG